ncbi:MAG TPA: cytochrome c maturation protein CcmE [Polyangia bacterium]|nr:cytochrome c maturation protein CcmE [Polyangia bacterium]
MNRKLAVQILVSALVVGGGLTYLVLTGFDDAMVYYKTVDELLGERAEFEGRPVRVNGLLVEGSVRARPGTDQFRFDLTKNGARLAVEFAGIMPDSMLPGRELVVQGVLQPGADLLLASEILTKCPSKYEEEARSRGER